SRRRARRGSRRAGSRRAVGRRRATAARRRHHAPGACAGRTKIATRDCVSGRGGWRDCRSVARVEGVPRPAKPARQTFRRKALFQWRGCSRGAGGGGVGGGGGGGGSETLWTARVRVK